MVQRRTLKLKEYGYNAFVAKKVSDKLAPLFEQSSYALRINASGGIDNGNDIHSDERICILSDSFGECSLMDEKDRFVSVCERHLNSNGYSIELLNFSMTGMNIFHAIFLLLAKILPLGMSKIIYFTSNSDYQTSRLEDGDFFTYDRDYSIFNETTKKIDRRGTPSFATYNKLMNVMYAICRDAKIDLIFALRPFDDDKRAKINNITKNFCVKKNIPYMDLQGFSGKDCYYDGTHLTKEGSQQFGLFFYHNLTGILSHSSSSNKSFSVDTPYNFIPDHFPPRVLKLQEYPAMARIVKETSGTADESYWGDSRFVLDTDENAFSDNGNNIRTENKIFVIGDSYIECLFMNPHERLLSVAERELRDVYSCEQELVNCSKGGSHILHCIFMFLAKVASMKPSTVLYAPSINDYKALCTFGNFYTNHKGLSIFKSSVTDYDRAKPLYSVYRLFVNIFYNVCRAFGHNLVFMLHPFYGEGSMDKLNETVIDFCNKKKLLFIDLRNFPEEEVKKMHYDRAQLLPYGAEIMGKLLAKELYDKGLIE